MGSSPDKELAYSQQEMGVLGARPANPCDIQDFDFTSFFFSKRAPRFSRDPMCKGSTAAEHRMNVSPR